MIKCFKNIILFILILVNCEYYNNYYDYYNDYTHSISVIRKCENISPHNYKDCIKRITNKTNGYCCFYKIKTEDKCRCGCMYLEDYNYRNIARDIENYGENIVIYCEGNNYKNYFIINMILFFIIFL